MTDVDVLVVGAGPVGLTAALELRRRGIECRVVDRLPSPAMAAKAVGIQPRTLEIWEAVALEVRGRQPRACSTATTPNVARSVRRLSAGRYGTRERDSRATRTIPRR
jgi:2-polyprenyl-6-methoxyphenol hydroxylase-like FAD-dependent oxidoreductase